MCVCVCVCELHVRLIVLGRSEFCHCCFLKAGIYVVAVLDVKPEVVFICPDLCFPSYTNTEG